MNWRVLDGLPANDVRTLIAAARRRRFDRDEVLFHEADPADTMHLIASGRVAVRKTTMTGRTVVLAVLGKGDAVGEMALLDDEAARSATVAALEPTETLAVHRDTFARVRAQHPSITDVLVRILVARVRELDERVTEAYAVAADDRVRRRLVALASVYGDDDGSITVPLAQEDLAELAGTTRVTVNRVLRDEQARGAVRLGRNRVTVLDVSALAKRGGIRA